MRRVQIARQKVQLFKPRIDSRYSEAEIVSHSEMKMPSQVVGHAAEIPPLVDGDTEVVAIDKSPASTPRWSAWWHKLANRGLRVIVAGLDQDYRGRPFEPLPQLMAVAEYVDKTLAVCMQCGAPANRSQRLVAAADRVVVGGAGRNPTGAGGASTPTATSPSSERWTSSRSTGRRARAGGRFSGRPSRSPPRPGRASASSASGPTASAPACGPSTSRPSARWP